MNTEGIIILLLDLNENLNKGNLLTDLTQLNMIDLVI